MKAHQLITAGPDRRGVTLTEVLMSMMIMSIGVASVATLFPIAALRSAQATRLTNAAITKLNVEALIKTSPEIVFDPDGDFWYSSPTTAAATQARWTRLTEHFRGGGEKNYIIDPAGYMSFANSYGYGGVSVASGLLDAVPIAGRSPTTPVDYFGNTDMTATAITPYPVLPRYDAGLRSQYFGSLGPLAAANIRDYELLSSKLSSLGDTWDTVVDDICEGFIDSSGSFSATPTANVVGVRIKDGVDLSSLVTSALYSGVLTIPDPELTRITVFNLDGTASLSFPLTAVSGQDCTWTEAADYNGDGQLSVRTLPIEFSVGTTAIAGVPYPDPSQIAVGRVLIQTKRTEDFTWMLTVRRGPDGRATGVDVVVMFGGSRLPQHERVFPAAFVKDSFGVLMDKTSGVDASGDPASPALKRGNWMLDMENARWYRISKYEDTGSQFLVTLETAVVAGSPGAGIGRAMILPTVVDVYPLGSIPLPDSMTPRDF
ncbi:MAG: prepilin-type N-terminal cleavage/methylation domain-containing protein [Planctomycetaceae bacterium]